ncbi:LysR family transcriptional regulator [Cognaticolwellia beringensis]|uniref:LysR family transcriptional regulator n=1 Tax=Cognaticolwellia beringensis TaxID=1967665 RepID=A0A222G663_9GAMM|nr:LysR family transcriptional regulator [Cognaticolwellia beringensis]ASP47232.1 LysR family transcriptional regulator [Cognaticolwellia beringensis]
MYSFEQLKVFITVCEMGSFSAAARKLKRAQSGVSQAIANLEISINQELFNREKNTPVLTANGKTLLPIAKSIIHQQRYFDQKLESLSNKYENELVIAIDESLVSSDLLNIFTPLSEQFPITHIEIISTSTFEVEELVRTGKAQAGLIYADSELKVDMDFFLLGQARFLTICAPEHPLVALNTVEDNDLKRYRQCVHRCIKQRELWFSYAISTKVWYANTHKTLIDLVLQGTGWASVPEQLIKQYLDQGSLIALPVAHEYSGWLTPVGCLISRSHPTGPVLTSLIESLQEYHFSNDHWEIRNK